MVRGEADGWRLWDVFLRREGKGTEGRRKGNNGFLTEEEGEVKKSRKRIREKKKEKPEN